MEFLKAALQNIQSAASGPLAALLLAFVIAVLFRLVSWVLLPLQQRMGRSWRYVWLIVAAGWAALSTAYFCAYQPPHPISGPLHGWDWFSNPQETLAEMRLPSITASLPSIQFAADGQRGWAVGGVGTILQTKDGGSTWTPQTSGTQDRLSSVSFAVDGLRAGPLGSMVRFFVRPMAAQPGHHRQAGLKLISTR
jgi:hypothetical protein